MTPPERRTADTRAPRSGVQDDDLSVSPESVSGGHAPAVDLDAAHEHLRFLDPAQPRHTYQLAPDIEGAPRRVLVGPLSAIAPHLTRGNEAGAGVFVMVNAGDLRGRKRANVVRIRFAFADLDGAPLPASEAHQAHGVIWSSPGKAHLYWRVDGVPLELFRPMQLGLAAALGGDPSVCDPPRVLRLAGFMHRKRAPYRVTAHALDHDAKPLTLADLGRLFPQVEAEVRLAQEARERRETTGAGAAPRRPLQAPHAFPERLLEVIRRKASTITTTGRHELIVWTARTCLDNGLSEREAEALTLRARDLLPARAGGPVPDAEVTDAVSWAYANLTPGEPWGVPATSAASIVPPGLAVARARSA